MGVIEALSIILGLATALPLFPGADTQDEQILVGAETTSTSAEIGSSTVASDSIVISAPTPASIQIEVTVTLSIAPSVLSGHKVNAGSETSRHTEVLSEFKRLERRLVPRHTAPQTAGALSEAAQTMARPQTTAAARCMLRRDGRSATALPPHQRPDIYVTGKEPWLECSRNLVFDTRTITSKNPMFTNKHNEELFDVNERMMEWHDSVMSKASSEAVALSSIPSAHSPAAVPATTTSSTGAVPTTELSTPISSSHTPSSGGTGFSVSPSPPASHGESSSSPSDEDRVTKTVTSVSFSGLLSRQDRITDIIVSVSVLAKTVTTSATSAFVTYQSVDPLDLKADPYINHRTPAMPGPSGRSHAVGEQPDDPFMNVRPLSTMKELTFGMMHEDPFSMLPGRDVVPAPDLRGSVPEGALKAAYLSQPPPVAQQASASSPVMDYRPDVTPPVWLKDLFLNPIPDSVLAQLSGATPRPPLGGHLTAPSSIPTTIPATALPPSLAHSPPAPTMLITRRAIPTRRPRPGIYVQPKSYTTSAWLDPDTMERGCHDHGPFMFDFANWRDDCAPGPGFYRNDHGSDERYLPEPSRQRTWAKDASKIWRDWYDGALAKLAIWKGSDPDKQGA